ncbi:MAG: holo-ACP synthase [Actinomycetaceae bacterium]|nr:holo-ACP synthase [Actinomycetaceae bacterium]
MGIDLVYIPDFLAQFEQAGTRFAQAFSAYEQRTARRRAGQTGQAPEYHLAARWAAKEAFIKAWSGTLIGQSPVISEEKVNMAEIEVRHDAYGRPYLQLHGEIARIFGQSADGYSMVIDSQGASNTEDEPSKHATRSGQLSLSISHDGDYATAIVVIP